MNKYINKHIYKYITVPAGRVWAGLRSRCRASAINGCKNTRFAESVAQRDAFNQLFTLVLVLSWKFIPRIANN